VIEADHLIRGRAQDPPDLWVGDQAGTPVRGAQPQQQRHEIGIRAHQQEALDAGKITLNTRWNVSEYAAGQAPTKLNLQAGDRVAVRDIILAEPRGDWNLADRFAVVEMFNALPPGGYRQSDYQVQPAPATQLVEAGDVIDLGDRVFEVLHVPGHSPGSIALWEAASGVLLSGDAVYAGPPVTVVHGGYFPSFGHARF
jgi:hypothetical protein